MSATVEIFKSFMERQYISVMLCMHFWHISITIMAAWHPFCKNGISTIFKKCDDIFIPCDKYNQNITTEYSPFKINMIS